MADNGLRAKAARKFRHTTDSNHELAVADNLLERQFDPDRPNVAWSADITYVPTADGWLYLVVVEDLFSRRIVGWSMDQTMTSRLVVDALDMAVRRRLPGDGLLAHSDRGSQYASEHYQRLLAKHGIRCSMSGVAQCWDNAPVESFFASLKKELVHHEKYTTREEAKASIFEYVEAFYNRVRRHSSLGFLSPEEFERSHNPNHPSLRLHFSWGSPSWPPGTSVAVLTGSVSFAVMSVGVRQESASRSLTSTRWTCSSPGAWLSRDAFPGLWRAWFWSGRRGQGCMSITGAKSSDAAASSPEAWV